MSNREKIIHDSYRFVDDSPGLAQKKKVTTRLGHDRSEKRTEYDVLFTVLFLNALSRDNASPVSACAPRINTHIHYGEVSTASLSYIRGGLCREHTRFKKRHDSRLPRESSPPFFRHSLHFFR